MNGYDADDILQSERRWVAHTRCGGRWWTLGGAHWPCRQVGLGQQPNGRGQATAAHLDIREFDDVQLREHSYDELQLVDTIAIRVQRKDQLEVKLGRSQAQPSA